MNGWTKEMAEKHNARVAAMESKTKHHDNPPRPEIQNSQQRERQKELDRSDEGKTQGPKSILARVNRGFCRVSFLLRRVRLLDVDAATASVKDVLDCCWISNLVDGDRPDQISLEVRQEKVASFKAEETIIEIQIP